MGDSDVSAVRRVVWGSIHSNFAFVEYGNPEEYGKGDRFIRGVPGIPEGVYREVDQIFITWVLGRIMDAERAAIPPPEAALESARQFFDQIVRLSGIQPGDPSIIPPRYAKPSTEPGRNTCTSFEDAMWSPRPVAG